MATILGDLWSANFAWVRVVDVSDDYRLMQSPLPSYLYPVLDERWLPVTSIAELPDGLSFDGYLYDWHETPSGPGEPWVVAVVDRTLAFAN